MSDKTEARGVETLLDLPRRAYDRATALRQDAAALGRDAWLTSLGTVGMVQDEGERLVDTVTKRRATLAKRGAKVEQRLDARVAEATRTLDIAGRRRAAVRRVETTVVDPIVGTLQRLGLPSRSEVRELSGKVDALTRRVNLLIAALETQAPAHRVYALRARDEGWEIVLEGTDAPVAVYATKDEALEKARAIASAEAPSQLVVYRKDGTIQDTSDY